MNVHDWCIHREGFTNEHVYRLCDLHLETLLCLRIKYTFTRS